MIGGILALVIAAIGAGFTTLVLRAAGMLIERLRYPRTVRSPAAGYQEGPGDRGSCRRTLAETGNRSPGRVGGP